MKLYHRLIPYTAAAANEAANREASNVATPAIAKYWASTSSTTWLQVTYTTSSPVVRVGIQRLGGAATISGVHTGTDARTLTPATGLALTPVTDSTGRTVASGPVQRVTTDRVWRVAFSGSFVDTAEIGAVYLFGAELSLDDALLRSEVHTVYPQTLVSLPNGDQFTVDRGHPRAKIVLRWRRPRSEDIEEIARLARAGICWLDLEVPGAPWMQWPVRLVQDSLNRQMATANQDEITLEFLEVV